MDLLHELPRGGHDHAPRQSGLIDAIALQGGFSPWRTDRRHDGQEKRCSLPRPRLRATHEVLALERQRQRMLLDGCRRAVPHQFNVPAQERGQGGAEVPEILERLRILGAGAREGHLDGLVLGEVDGEGPLLREELRGVLHAGRVPALAPGRQALALPEVAALGVPLGLQLRHLLRAAPRLLHRLAIRRRLGSVGPRAATGLAAPGTATALATPVAAAMLPGRL
mmetsp:Transcript_63875/g.169712  ORF Transcript_63875/g.169712 Transcript_63875/m.169712 type:complete len:224 (+) Transcript_63875:1601-2272(+)